MLHANYCSLEQTVFSFLALIVGGGGSPVNPCLKAVQMHQAYLKYESVLIKYTLAADDMQGGGLVNTNWQPQPLINST